MNLVVADASLVIKWLLPDRLAEADTELALALFERVERGDVSLCQPDHWLAEVGAVLARLSPQTAERQIAALWDMEIPVVSGAEISATAVRLAIQLRHHLFDTLYHAVALAVPGATLVTADEIYYRKSRSLGRIQRLADVA